MASTELVTAICERMMEKLQKENPNIEYKRKPKKEKEPKECKQLKSLKKPKFLN